MDLGANEWTHSAVSRFHDPAGYYVCACSRLHYRWMILYHILHEWPWLDDFAQFMCTVC